MNYKLWKYFLISLKFNTRISQFNVILVALLATVQILGTRLQLNNDLLVYYNNITIKSYQ